MRYGKLINGIIQYAPRKIRNGDTVTYNPLPEMLMEFGYFPVRLTDQPVPQQGYYANYHWEERNGEIVQVWEVIENPAQEESPDELLAMLEAAL